MLYELLALNFAVPGVLLVAAWFLRRKQRPYPGPHGSAKWKIDFSGYNTPLARRSPAHWEFAQTAAPEVFLRKGKTALIFAAVFTALGALSRNGVSAAVICGVGFGFVLVSRAFRETEQLIRDHVEK